LLLLLLVTLGAVPAPDPCGGLLPQPVLTAVGKAYPGFRVVRGSDYSPEDLAYSHADGLPCPGIASNDVDGNGLADYAFFVLSAKGKALLLSARVLPGSSPRIGRLMDFGDHGLGRSFVHPADPGEYTDLFEAISESDAAPEPGRVAHYVSMRPGFSAGSMESSEIAFFFTGRQWVHLWLAD
jgi:hypothetical protein